MRLFCLVHLATLLLLSRGYAQGVEYLPGIQWPEPPVVNPGQQPTAPPSDAIVLFDGTDLSGWNNADKWKVADGAMIVGGGTIQSKQSFGDCQLHIEWSSPTPVTGKGQGRGNSGVYFMGQYEVQILDSFENKTYFDGQAGAIYKQSPPMVNATRPPGEWNVYDIVFTAPRFAADGTLNSPAHVTLLHNGVLLHNHFQLRGETAWHKPASYTAHADKLPIKLQDHGNPVRYRNIWVREFEQLQGKQVEEPQYLNHKTGKRRVKKRKPEIVSSNG